MILRGASILQEPCPRCGAVQIKYKAKVYCTNEDDLESLLNSPSPQEQSDAPAKTEEANKIQSASQTTEALRKLMEEKLNNLSKQLDSTTDVGEQARLLDLISKYLETLEKVKRAVS